jgi:predicted acetyltransferase
MQTLFRRFAAGQNGLVECAAEDWWRLRVIRRWNPDVVSRLVVARGEDGAPEGYASFSLEPAGDLWGFRVTCSHLVACTPRALSGLLGYFRSFRGLGQYLVWTGPPHDPIPLMAGGGAESIQPQRTARFMARILDVKGALEGRGYPPVAGAATLAVEDDLFPENEGTWRIQASGGEVSAGRIDGAAPGARMGIRGLSALFTGYVSPGELVRAGLAAGDEAALSLLGKLFSGPAPWSMDFF